MATRDIIINGIKRAILSLPDDTPESVWQEKISAYMKNSSYQKVQIMHNFNVDFKIRFVAENIDFKISSLPTPEGYTSMREFAKQQLAPIYNDMIDFSYPEAIAKIIAKQVECDSHPEWEPILSRGRLEKAKIEILTMLGSLG